MPEKEKEKRPQVRVTKRGHRRLKKLAADLDCTIPEVIDWLLDRVAEQERNERLRGE